MKFRVIFNAEQEVTGEPVEHIEFIESSSEAELKRAIPQLLLTVGQTGLIHYESKINEWSLIPAHRLRHIRATYSAVVLVESAVGTIGQA